MGTRSKSTTILIMFTEIERLKAILPPRHANFLIIILALRKR